MQDLKQNTKIVKSVTAQTLTAAANGTAADLQGFNSAFISVSVGASGDTLSASVKWDYKIEHSDDNSTFTAVTSNTEVTGGTVDSSGIFTTVDDGAEDDAVYGIGYVGGKRYVRVAVAKTGTHTNGTPTAAVIIVGHPLHGPTADQT